MTRVIILGANGSLGRHVLRRALAAGHDVTVTVRALNRLPAEVAPRVAIHVVDLSTADPAELGAIVGSHDALINCAGHVSGGQRFVDLVDRVVASVERLPPALKPACWFLAGAALLDIDESGRRGIDLPKLRTSYWPHGANFDRLSRASIDWRLLCPGPMVEEPALGVERLRISFDTLPVPLPRVARALPAPLVLPLLGSLVPQLIVPYADAAALMLAHLDRGSGMRRRRVGMALPAGLRGHKPRWAADAATHGSAASR